MNPLTLPEIREALAPLLARDDLARCARVCKDWHASFLDFLWTSIDIDTEHSHSKGPSHCLLQRHRSLVRHLAYQGKISVEHEKMHFPALKTLYLHDPHYDRGTRRSSMDIIPRHAFTLTRLKLHGTKRNGCWAFPAGLSGLTCLSLMDIYVIPRSMEQIRSAFTQLETLELVRSGLSAYSKSLKGDWKMKDLTLASVRGMNLDEELELIRQCSLLKRLSWGSSQAFVRLPIGKFVQLVSANTWPELEELHLRNVEVSDEHLSLILNGMQHVLRLAISTCKEPSLQASAAFRPHYAWLKELNISITPRHNAALVVDVLKSCPRLEILKSPIILVDSIMDDVPWACEGSLKVLEVFFWIPSAKRDEQQKVLLQRLSKLSKLERLDLSSVFKCQQSLDIRLKKGLGQLSTLTRLRELAFRRTVQEMTIEDAEWMIEHWKNLKVVDGVPSLRDAARSIRVVEKFRQSGIEATCAS